MAAEIERVTRPSTRPHGRDRSSPRSSPPAPDGASDRVSWPDVPRMVTVVLTVVAAACQAGARAQPPASAARDSPLAPRMATHGDRRGATSATMPGPATVGARLDAPTRNRECEACHVEIAAEWRGSLHQRSYVDPEFARALEREPQPFCRGCHAPEADPRAPAPAPLAALGVACVTCHAPAGLSADAVLAVLGDSHAAPHAVLAGPGDSHAAPHAVVASAAFAGAPACAACHEFEFPGRAAPMQMTVREHAASRFAATSCADCHMPWTGDGASRHRSHVFAASRDPALLQRSLRVEATRGPGVVALRLVPAAVGHAVPTGDLFRRLLVEAEARGAAGAVVGRDARTLERRFERRRESSLRTVQVEVADDRPGAPGSREADGAAVVLLELGAEADVYPVRWRVVHQRVEFHRSEDVVIAGELELAVGDLPPLREEP